MALTAIALPAQAKVHHHKRHHAAGVSADAEYADIVIDAETGRILHATDPDGLRHPASLTKMMTLYLTFQALESGRLRLNQSLPVSVNASEQSPSKLGLRRGTHIKVEDAILGVVTESANDAATVLGEALGDGSVANFAQMMTRQAHALGMSNTVYRNASGLPDPGQVTTARDMAILGHALIYHFAQYYPYFSHDSFVYAGVYHHNHNHLMDRYAGMDGIKTGYIRASGFNLVASAMRGNTRLIGVVFGGHSATARDNQMALLLDQGFSDARQDKWHPSNRVAQGDSSGSEDDDESYVSLPAKTTVASLTSGSLAAGAGMDDSSFEAPAQTLAKPQTSGGWGIQVGAYNDPAMGRQALDKLTQAMPQYLGRGVPVMQEVAAGGVTMYRARLSGLDEKTARAACAALMKRGQSCLTVAPEVKLGN